MEEAEEGEVDDDRADNRDDEGGKLENCQAEILLGLDEAAADDPLAQLQVMQRQLQLLQELSFEGNFVYTK